MTPNGSRDSSGGGFLAGVSGMDGSSSGAGGIGASGVEVSGGDPVLGGKSATAITLGSGMTRL